MEKKIIHMEGLIVLIATIYIYALCDFSWLLFFVLLFAPDISMFAYLINNRIGAQIYNLFHTYIVSILLIMIGVFFKLDTILMIGLIWTAHIGMDRMFGYGLKYKTGFKDTHIQKL
ncbi:MULTISPECIES: DUF4260 domain-containing protein [Bacillus cereus group]|uniref:DUF4260 domain-containing protein n=1 Tax=Bacillus cereus TaxID=1396 RepID=A0AA44TEJ9_BACCE|nr:MULTISPECIES: DUF4260 domain-containing protein [Bacillus cereus group]PFN04367.1 DUF4260 domain-containing protein [Bacillus cereus]PFO83306.1 DUF4260 domain-containing protein [Bacillus cereus]PFR29349.1 DUF4260 domain-containing protein [Bacillus cereus]PFS00674.1 DUF4260 domain-containing protein [Bacillus cereus]